MKVLEDQITIGARNEVPREEPAGPARARGHEDGSAGPLQSAPTTTLEATPRPFANTAREAN